MANMTTANLVLVDYTNPQHSADLLILLNNYALDPMGGGEPLPIEVRANLIRQLQNTTGAFSVLCYLDKQAVGLANCFQTLSTFKAKPIVNIHDICIKKEFRGQGLSQRLLEKVAKIATERGACKLTLEVLEGNDIAQASYRKFGFEGYELNPAIGKALFWQKQL